VESGPGQIAQLEVCNGHNRYDPNRPGSNALRYPDADTPEKRKSYKRYQDEHLESLTQRKAQNKAGDGGRHDW
jgi:hypothetical protein